MNKLAESSTTSEEGIGNRLSFILDDVKEALEKLKNLETSSKENGKIGIGVIKDSRKNLEQLRASLENQIKGLQNNLPES